jgi:ribosomal subunit interface protein
MDIRVAGHQVATGEALRGHVTTRLQAIANKYFSRSISANATFGRGPHDHGFVCDIIAHVMQGVVLKAHGQAMEAHPAFDQAAERIEKQLRRYMRRLKSHHGGGNGQAMPSVDEIASDAGYSLFAAPALDDESDPGDHPVLIAETRVDVPEATVSDAVMMLDLRNTTALLFRNSATGAFNMVYRRPDGAIGWVEPQRG